MMILRIYSSLDGDFRCPNYNLEPTTRSYELLFRPPARCNSGSYLESPQLNGQDPHFRRVWLEPWEDRSRVYFKLGGPC